MIRNCWSKSSIVGAVTMADLTQLRDYNKRIDGFDEDELTKLIKGWVAASASSIKSVRMTTSQLNATQK